MHEEKDKRDSDVLNSPRKAVVIGGAGFLGKRLVTMLGGGDGSFEPPDEWPRFDHVHVLDRATYLEDARAKEEREKRGISISSATGDIRSKEDLRAALRGAHTVFHLASLVDVGLKKNPAIEEINVVGTRNVVEVCQELGVPFLVYTSSEDVVFSETPVSGGDESLPYPTKPLHEYVRTKIEGERAVRAADGERGLRTCSIRPVHIYGPNDPHAIVESLEAFAEGRVPFLLGNGSARFDVVHVDNVVHAHLLAAAKLHDPATRDQVGGGVYFAGEGHAPNYFEFLRPFAEARGIRMPRLRLPAPVVLVLAQGMEIVHRVTGLDVPFHRFHYHILVKDFFFSNANAERDLGYQPIVTKEEGMAQTVAWVRELPVSS
ncbi:MAG: NAD-dependent epimerase/dehydratase family protein [Deltaproteobacteria bacterium]|nr:NAD-dependent epimerase/dehydratase family protein [Deltaproteobacteria bacterium]